MLALRDAYFRVIRSFLVEQQPPETGQPWSHQTAPRAGASPFAGPAPFTAAAPVGPAAPPPLRMSAGPGQNQAQSGASGGGFVFAVAPLFGGGDVVGPTTAGAGRSGAMDVPGVGPVSRQQLEQVETRVEPILVELFGPAGIQNLSGADFPTALVKLDDLHTRGEVNDEQYAALCDAMVQFQAFLGG